MPLSMYGNTNPKGLEPFQIESTLAPLAVGNNQAEAQMMLENYQQQRQASTNLYGQDLAQQHQAFYDQLASQMQQNYVKELPNYMKEPGGAQFASQLPGMVSAVGADPSAWTSLAQAADVAQGAKNVEAAGKGFQSASEGGFLMNPQQIPGLQGVQGQLTDTARVRAEQIREAGANARASTAAATAALPRVTTEYTDPRFNTKNTVSFGPKTSLQARDDFLRNQAGLPVTDQPPPNAPIPGSGATSLPPMAQTDTPANAPSPPPQNTAAGTPALQATVKANLANAPPDVRKDVMAAAAKNGGNPVIGRDAQGPYVLGASGTKHR